MTAAHAAILGTRIGLGVVGKAGPAPPAVLTQPSTVECCRWQRECGHCCRGQAAGHSDSFWETVLERKPWRRILGDATKGLPP